MDSAELVLQNCPLGLQLMRNSLRLHLLASIKIKIAFWLLREPFSGKGGIKYLLIKQPGGCSSSGSHARRRVLR